MLHTLDYVMPVAKAVPKKLCNSLIEKFEASDNFITRDSDYHQFKELNLSEKDEFKGECDQLQRASKHLMDFYKREMGVKYFPTSYRFEEFRMKRYDPNNKDQFDWHCDVGDYPSARRFMVCFFYLNTVADGGETYFDWEENDINSVKVTPEQGTAVLFPPFWTHPHKGAMPLSGPKYIVSTYAQFI